MKKIRIFALMLVFVLILTGCNKASSARSAIELFNREMNSLDYKSAFAYIADYDGFGFTGSEGVEDLINIVARSLKIDVINDSSGNLSANIDVRITTVDLRELYKRAAETVVPQFYRPAVGGGSISQDELRTSMINEIVALSGQSSVPTVSTDCTLLVVKNDSDKWEIRLDTASYNAITGYLDEANALVSSGTLMGTTAPTTAPTVPAVSGSDVPSDSDAD